MKKDMLKKEDKNLQEDIFLKRCTDLCFERMAVEGINTDDFDKIQIICVTAGTVVMHLLNHKMHSQIAFHVHYEGNRRTGTPIYAMPINVNSSKETYANTAKEAVTTMFSVC